MRLFIAVALPDDERAQLARYQEQVDVAGLRPARQFHVTLRFIGEQLPDDCDLDALKERLSRFCFRPFDASLTAIGSFGSRVVWTGVSGAWQELKRNVDDALGFPAGQDAEPGFVPHVTLFRAKMPGGSGTMDLTRFPAPPTLRFTVSHVTLYESTLTSQGPVYTALAQSI
ncbi:RNA 2',3'-cyclic phosphodiesterase [Candidatus Woesearchaeota archaeon CG_4_10_14_0_2_um_filter_57_5]|nr:MAG: 2'-5' RNA ligase [Candidatus Woesearchaeota archaeon CG1_02_57_44]PIN67476.1 MAG: RNA 2',3'-cyclic phosphodiesterase [Candidatus Woesearchaeota archaeon CG11_big_fil_rev_8_21_14_0_20_57_5]PIZ54920.1 MAG: RNA 2',3'-cyclic phosphodiesterase [Candidatus Woesearchaeota archaeon CG_4_10_14_0_2_um_filter_57_5]